METVKKSNNNPATFTWPLSHAKGLVVRQESMADQYYEKNNFNGPHVKKIWWSTLASLLIWVPVAFWNFDFNTQRTIGLILGLGLLVGFVNRAILHTYLEITLEDPFVRLKKMNLVFAKNVEFMRNQIVTIDIRPYRTKFQRGNTQIYAWGAKNVLELAKGLDLVYIELTDGRVYWVQSAKPDELVNSLSRKLKAS